MLPVYALAALLSGGVLLSALAPLLPAEQPAGAALTAAASGHPADRAPGTAGGSSNRELAASLGRSGRAPARQVWVEGDSVMVAAAGTVSSALGADGWRAVVAGWPGLHLWAAVDVLSRARPQMGSVAVIELGDNDCCDGTAFGRTLDQAMAALAGLHVIWLTGTATRPGQDATNAAIRAAVVRWPNLEVADWATVVAQHPDAVFPDRLHLTPQGEALMASFLRDRLDTWYRRASAPAALAAAGRAGARR
jgi:hypothetical protein